MSAESASPATDTDERDPGLLIEVHRVLTEKAELDVPSVDTDLLATGVLDSLALVEVLFHLEDDLGVTVPLDQAEVADFRTVRSIARLIASDDYRP